MQKLLTCILKTQPVAGCGSTDTGHCCVLPSLAHFSKHTGKYNYSKKVKFQTVFKHFVKNIYKLQNAV